MTTRAEQKIKRQEEILIAALEHFTKKGYASTKTSDISKSLHISEGLLFHYFKTKELLLEALVDIATQENDSWTQKEITDPIMYFEQVTYAVLECLREDSIGAKFFILVAQLKQGEGIPEHIYKRVKTQEQEVEKIVAIIEKGQQLGTIRQGNSRSLALLYANTLQAIGIQYALYSEVPLPEVDWIVDILKNHSS